MIGPEPVESPSGRQLAQAAAALATLIDTSAYVGEVYSLGYDDALVQIHDHHRALVGGIPALSFLLATRIIDPVDFDPRRGRLVRRPASRPRPGRPAERAGSPSGTGENRPSVSAARAARTGTTAR